MLDMYTHTHTHHKQDTVRNVLQEKLECVSKLNQLQVYNVVYMEFITTCTCTCTCSCYIHVHIHYIVAFVSCDYHVTRLFPHRETMTKQSRNVRDTRHCTMLPRKRYGNTVFKYWALVDLTTLYPTYDLCTLIIM